MIHCPFLFQDVLAREIRGVYAWVNGDKAWVRCIVRVGADMEGRMDVDCLAPMLRLCANIATVVASIPILDRLPKHYAVLADFMFIVDPFAGWHNFYHFCRKVPVRFPTLGDCLRGVCAFSPCLRGFLQAAPVSSNPPTLCRLVECPC